MKGAKKYKEYATFEEAFSAANATQKEFEPYDKRAIERKLKIIEGMDPRWIVVDQKLYHIHRTPNEGLLLLNSFSPFSVMTSAPFAMVTILPGVEMIYLSAAKYKRDMISRAIYAAKGYIMTTITI